MSYECNCSPDWQVLQSHTCLTLPHCAWCLRQVVFCDARLVCQGLIKAPKPATKRGEASPPDDDDFWDKQGRNGVARQLQSTEDALPGGRPGSTQPEQAQSKGASARHLSVP